MKRNNFLVCLSLAFVGIVLLGIDRLAVSADSATSYSSFTVITIIALILLAVAAIWFYKQTFE